MGGEHKKASVRRGGGMYPWRHTYISLALANGAGQIWVSKQAGRDLDRQDARWIKGRQEPDQAELDAKPESGGKTVAGEGESA